MKFKGNFNMGRGCQYQLFEFFQITLSESLIINRQMAVYYFPHSKPKACVITSFWLVGPLYKLKCISNCQYYKKYGIHLPNDDHIISHNNAHNLWSSTWLLALARPLVNHKQGKSEGFDSCDRPGNFTEIGFKSSIFQPVWPWNLMDDPKKR